jgi:hypothetical protein
MEFFFGRVIEPRRHRDHREKKFLARVTFGDTQITRIKDGTTKNTKVTKLRIA